MTRLITRGTKQLIAFNLNGVLRGVLHRGHARDVHLGDDDDLHARDVLHGRAHVRGDPRALHGGVRGGPHGGAHLEDGGDLHDHGRGRGARRGGGVRGVRTF